MGTTPQISLLISSAGRRVGLMRCFQQDAARLGVGLRVVATDAQPALSAACHFADKAAPVPRCESSDFIPALLEICREESINVLVPTIDPELPLLAANKPLFDRIGVRVIISSLETVSIARNKLFTARHLAAAGIASPRTAPLSEFLKTSNDWSWPVLLKPVAGSSSAGVRIVHSIEQCLEVSETRSEYVAQEFLTGTEATLNMFVDLAGKLKCCVPHARVETRGGEVSKGTTMRSAELQSLADDIVTALPGLAGALCCQAMVNTEGRASVFEINARFGGGFPLCHTAGGRFSQWILEEALALPSTACNEWVSGVTMLRFDDAVYVRK